MWAWQSMMVLVPELFRIELRTLEHVRLAQASMRRFAEQLGFARKAQWEITIAASEAGTNLVKHGGGGELSLAAIVQPRPGVRIEARDHGPGIPDFDAALRDHISEGHDVRVRERDSPPRRGLGTGLGAIHRLTDTMGWENLAEGGLLWAEKYR